MNLTALDFAELTDTTNMVNYWWVLPIVMCLIILCTVWGWLRECGKNICCCVDICGRVVRCCCGCTKEDC